MGLLVKGFLHLVLKVQTRCETGQDSEGRRVQARFLQFSKSEIKMCLLRICHQEEEGWVAWMELLLTQAGGQHQWFSSEKKALTGPDASWPCSSEVASQHKSWPVSSPVGQSAHGLAK